MDRRESIKTIAATLAAAAAGTDITVHAAHPKPEKVQESLVERMRRKLKPLEGKGVRYSVANEWDLSRLSQRMTVAISLDIGYGCYGLWPVDLYTKHEAIGCRNAKSLETLAKWRVDTLAWQILDRFGIEGNHGPT